MYHSKTFRRFFPKLSCIDVAWCIYISGSTSHLFSPLRLFVNMFLTYSLAVTAHSLSLIYPLDYLPRRHSSRSPSSLKYAFLNSVVHVLLLWLLLHKNIYVTILQSLPPKLASKSRFSSSFKNLSHSQI